MRGPLNLGPLWARALARLAEECAPPGKPGPSARAALGNQRSAAGRYVHASHSRAPRTSRQHAIVWLPLGIQALNS
jgi:hypothetical protein